MAVVILLVWLPFMGNGKYEVEHHTLKTDTYNKIQYSKVITVEYDLYKTKNWWTWRALDEEEKNVKITIGE